MRCACDQNRTVGIEALDLFAIFGKHNLYGRGDIVFPGVCNPYSFTELWIDRNYREIPIA